MRRLSSDVNNRPTIQCTVSESVGDHVYFGPPKKIADFQKHKNMYGYAAKSWFLEASKLTIF